LERHPKRSGAAKYGLVLLVPEALSLYVNQIDTYQQYQRYSRYPFATKLVAPQDLMMNGAEDSTVTGWLSPKTQAIPQRPSEGGGQRLAARIDWATFELLLLIWAPVAAAGIYAKWAMLRWESYSKIAISVGRPGLMWNANGASLFTFGEKLSFFRLDLLLSIVVVPLALALLSMLPRKRLLPWPLSLICIAWIVAINVQLEAFRMIGSFQSWNLLQDGLRWGFENARQAMAYVLGMAVFRTLTLSAVVAMAAMMAPIRNVLPGAWVRRSRAAVLVTWAVLVLITGLSWLPWMPRTSGHSSVLLASIAALPDPALVSSLGSLSQAELGHQYRLLSQAPQRKSTPSYWGAARDYDVLFFVLETTPERCVAFDGPIDDLPNVRRLREQAWVGARHYTTYPNTARALFSLLTSMYPPDNSKDPSRFRDHVNSGMIRKLTDAGYETAVYGSSASILPWARDVFENLGFTRIRAADGGPGSSVWARLGILPGLSPNVDTQAYVMHQQKLDLLALDQLKADLQHWTESNQRFAAVYLPQISHGPWGDIRSHGQEKNLLARCRALAELQDGWLGQILSLLEQRGRLSRTLIVVTGDHGVRSSVEDPAFRMGVTDNYSFQVPFLLYAPGLLHSSNILHWITSHIDVAPSILDLLGVSRNTDYEQGTALWDERIAQRTTYFLANVFLGVDGYYSNGKFYSWNRTLDTAYENDNLRFDGKDIVPNRSALHDKISENLQTLDQLRSAWLRVPEKSLQDDARKRAEGTGTR